MQRIIITIGDDGGCFVDKSTIPPGVEVEVRDFDYCERNGIKTPADAEAEGVATKLDEHGGEYVSFVTKGMESKGLNARKAMLTRCLRAVTRHMSGCNANNPWEVKYDEWEVVEEDIEDLMKEIV